MTARKTTFPPQSQKPRARGESEEGGKDLDIVIITKEVGFASRTDRDNVLSSVHVPILIIASDGIVMHFEQSK